MKVSQLFDYLRIYLRPPVFVSSVTRELGGARQVAVNTLGFMACDPDWQGRFATSDEDIRTILRKRIDRCKFVVHIVGHCYGAEPPKVDMALGRVSYTQFEALYAKSCGKKVYYLLADGNLCEQRPKVVDAAKSRSHADQADAVERRRLQLAYRKSILGGEAFYSVVKNADQVENALLKLREDIAPFHRWLKTLTAFVTTALGAVLVMLIYVLWMLWGVGDEIRSQSGKIDEIATKWNKDRVLEYFQSSAESAYDKEIAAARRLPTRLEREDAARAASAKRDQKKKEAEEFVDSIEQIGPANEVTQEYAELLRVLSSEGIDSALAYIDTKRETIIDRASRRAAKARTESRADLMPLLQDARISQAAGDYERAAADGEQILALEPAWLDAIGVQCRTLRKLGEEASRRGDLSEAVAFLRESCELARRWAHTDDPGNPHASFENSMGRGNIITSNIKLGQAVLASEEFTDVELAEAELAFGVASDLAEKRSEESKGVLFSDGAEIERAEALAGLSDIRRHRGDLKNAITLCERQLAVVRGISGMFQGPSYWDHRYRVTQVLGRLATLYLDLREPDKAESCYAEQVKIAREVVEMSEGQVGMRLCLASCLCQASCYRVTGGQWKEAEGYREEAIAILKRILAEELPQMRFAPSEQYGVSYSSGHMAGFLTADSSNAYSACRAAEESSQVDESRRLDNASSFVASNLEIVRGIVLYESRAKGALGELLVISGDLDCLRGNADSARRAYEEALGIQAALSEAEPENVKRKLSLAHAHSRLSTVVKEGEATLHLSACQGLLFDLDERGLLRSPSDLALLRRMNSELHERFVNDPR